LDQVTLDYACFLPISARLPLAWGAQLTAWRGRWCSRHDRDWRSIALGKRYVHERTFNAVKYLLDRHLYPTCQDHLDSVQRLNEKLLSKDAITMTNERFVYAAYEEWQAALIQANRLSELMFEGESSHERLPRQAVIAAMHVDSPMLGLVQLGRWGRKLCALSSNVVEDPRVPEPIQRFFRAKYLAMSKHWHGGRCMHKETELAQFLRAGRDGFSLAVFCDVPGGVRAELHEKGIWTSFLGERRLVAPAAFRIAQRLALPIVAMYCKRVTPNRYQIYFSDVFPAHDIETASAGVYEFWSDKILENPQAWWASDLLDVYPTCPKKKPFEAVFK